MPETFKFVEDRFAPPAPLPSTTQDTSKLETFDFVDEFEPVQPAPEVEEFEEMVTEFDRHGKEVSLPVYDDAGKRLHRPKYAQETNDKGETIGRMTHSERGVMTYDEWLKQKNEGDVDWWAVATGAVKHLAGGFTKIPGKIKEEGWMEASANIPESFLAAMEGVRMIGGGAGRLLAKPFRTEEEENKAEYEAYSEFGDQIFRQLELRKSRMGDVARMFGAKELAEVYDDGIDPEVADSLSLIFDPTYLVGGGLVKVGAAGMRHVPKVTNKYAKQVMAAASKAANTKIGAAGGKVLKEVGQRVATPITSLVSGTGKAGEMAGRGLQWAGEEAGKWAVKHPGKAKAVQTAVGAGTGYAVAPEGQELWYALGGAAGGRYGLKAKPFKETGESIEKAAQRIGGAAEAAQINSVRVSGLGTVAKTRKMHEDVAKQFVKYDNRVANKLLSGAAKIADTAAVGAGMGAGIGSLMPTDPNNPGWAAGLGIGTFAAPAGLASAKALSNLARVEISRGGVPSAAVRLRIKETPDHQLASEAVVERFAAGLPEEQRVRFVDPDRGLSVDDMATQAEAVNWAMGAKRYAGKDVDLFVGNAQEVVAQTGKPFHETVAGFWDEPTNKIYINTDAEVSTMTLLHEVFHPTETWSSRQKKFDTELEETVDVDQLQDLQTDLVQTIVGTYAPDGSQMKAGLYSADELGKLIDQYNSKLYPDQKSNIIAKKAEIAAEFKKSGGADTPDLTLMNRELDELTIKQDDRVKELAAFDLLPESEKRNFIAREILSEQFAMFGESARHGIIRKARNIALKKDYFRDKFLGMEIDRLKFNTLGRVRKTLEQVGVKFDLAGNPRGDMTATSVIFKDPKTGRQMVVDPGVEHLIAQYIIEKDKLVNRVSETAEVGGSEMTFKASDAAKKNKDGTPKVPRAIIERWAESGWVKTDKSGDIVNSTGGKWQPGQRPAFTTARERTRMDKDRVAALVAALEPVTKQIGDEEESVGAVRWRETADGGKNFSGGHFDDAQMAAIMNAPDDVVRPVFKENIRMMNEAVKNREGQPFLADYWKAITGKGYDSKARMKVQLFTPIGMSISSHGNFNATVFNIGYFENKINRWLGQSGKKKFWKEWADEDGRVDVDAFRRDVNELLGTHFADDRNVRYPDNIKKEKMYSFLGVKTVHPGRKDWNVSAKDRRMIHFLRTDRMQELTPGMGDNFPINYGKAKDRYMPGEPIKVQQEKIKKRMDESAAEFEKTLGPVEKQIYDVLPIPKDAAENYRLKNNRNPASGKRLNTRVVFEDDKIYYVAGDKTPGDWIKQVQKVMSPDEIQEARRWYSDVRGAFETYFGKDDGPRYMLAWLLANKSEKPSGAMRNALLAAEEIASGVTGGKKAGLNDAALRSIFMREQIPGSGTGRKLYDFTDAALGSPTRRFFGNMEDAGGPAVIDRHTFRDVGYVDSTVHRFLKKQFGEEAVAGLKLDSKEPNPSGHQYEVGSEWINRELLPHLNDEEWGGGKWTPEEAQAVGWTAMTKILDSAVDETVHNAIQKNSQTMAMELMFGEGAPYLKKFPELQDMSLPELKKTTREVLTEAVDIAKEVTGVNVVDVVHGMGGWMDYDVAPNLTAQLTGTKAGVIDFMDVLGYITQQTEMYGMHPAAQAIDLAYGIYDVDGKVMSTDGGVEAVYKKLREEHPDLVVGFMPDRNNGQPGILIGVETPKAKNKRGKEVEPGKMKVAAREELVLARVQEVQDTLKPTLQKISDELGVDFRDRWAKTEAVATGNNWKKKPDGQDYTRRLGARYGRDIQARLDDTYGPKLEQRLRKSIQEVERARKAESETGTQTGQVRAMPGGLRSTRQSLPPPPLTPEATRFILDRVARFTPREMDSRKDRAMEILQKFIEQ